MWVPKARFIDPEKDSSTVKMEKEQGVLGSDPWGKMQQIPGTHGPRGNCGDPLLTRRELHVQGGEQPWIGKL